MAVRSVASDTAEFVAVRRCCWPASMARWLDDRGMFWPVVEQPSVARMCSAVAARCSA